MTDKTEKTNIDTDDRTVIDLKGSEQHHDLKGNPGKKGDPDHAAGSGEASEAVQEAVKKADNDGAVASALKDAVDKS